MVGIGCLNRKGNVLVLGVVEVVGSSEFPCSVGSDSQHAFAGVNGITDIVHAVVRQKNLGCDRRVGAGCFTPGAMQG